MKLPWSKITLYTSDKFKSIMIQIMFIYYLQREAIEVIPPLAIIYQQLNELNVYEKYGKTIDLLHWVLVQLRDPYITSVNKRNVRMKAYEYYIKH